MLKRLKKSYGTDTFDRACKSIIIENEARNWLVIIKAADVTESIHRVISCSCIPTRILPLSQNRLLQLLGIIISANCYLHKKICLKNSSTGRDDAQHHALMHTL